MATLTIFILPQLNPRQRRRAWCSFRSWPFACIDKAGEGSTSQTKEKKKSAHYGHENQNNRRFASLFMTPVNAKNDYYRIG